ncbi:methylglyoxal synthase [Trueperella sp.]|uniref:methylglyoxal synthase n=1 Tax=Trueperella sp. TaxID=2699835 RepID=UPI003736815D
MRIALVAHDGKKQELLEWTQFNFPVLKEHILCGTGTTATLIRNETGLDVEILKSGPKGGDAQIGARIVEDRLDAMFFFWDPETAQPHDPDVKALLRLATQYNIPIAMNRATADILVGSPLFYEEGYERNLYDPEARDPYLAMEVAEHLPIV